MEKNKMTITKETLRLKISEWAEDYLGTSLRRTTDPLDLFFLKDYYDEHIGEYILFDYHFTEGTQTLYCSHIIHVGEDYVLTKETVLTRLLREFINRLGIRVVIRG